MIWGYPHFIPFQETSTWYKHQIISRLTAPLPPPEDAVSSFQWLHCNPILRGPVDASLGVADVEKADTTKKNLDIREIYIGHMKIYSISSKYSIYLFPKWCYIQYRPSKSGEAHGWNMGYWEIMLVSIPKHVRFASIRSKPMGRQWGYHGEMMG